ARGHAPRCGDRGLRARPPCRAPPVDAHARVYALLGLVKRYGAPRVEEVCQLALTADLLDVTRLKRMLALAAPPPATPPPARVIPLARYLRPASEDTLPRPRDDDGGAR